jgi:hypothetical protein
MLFVIVLVDQRRVPTSVRYACIFLSSQPTKTSEAPSTPPKAGPARQAGEPETVAVHAAVPLLG